MRHVNDTVPSAAVVLAGSRSAKGDRGKSEGDEKGKRERGGGAVPVPPPSPPLSSTRSACPPVLHRIWPASTGVASLLLARADRGPPPPPAPCATASSRYRVLQGPRETCERERETRESTREEEASVETFLFLTRRWWRRESMRYCSSKP